MREKGGQITVRDTNSSYSRLLVLFLLVVMMMMMMMMCTMIVISRCPCSCSTNAEVNWIYLGTPWTGGSASIKPPIDPQLDIRLSNNSTTCHWHTSIPCPSSRNRPNALIPSPTTPQRPVVKPLLQCFLQVINTNDKFTVLRLIEHHLSGANDQGSCIIPWQRDPIDRWNASKLTPVTRHLPTPSVAPWKRAPLLRRRRTSGLRWRMAHNSLCHQVTR